MNHVKVVEDGIYHIYFSANFAKRSSSGSQVLIRIRTGDGTKITNYSYSSADEYYSVQVKSTVNLVIGDAIFVTAEVMSNEHVYNVLDLKTLKIEKDNTL